MAPLGDISCSWKVFGTAAWNTKSVIGESAVKLAAVKVMMVIVGDTADRSKAKVMRRGPFSKAVIEGM